VPSVVASWAYFSIDLRHFHDDVMLRLAAEVEPLCRASAGGCDVEVTRIQQALATRFHGPAFDAVRTATERLRYPSLELPSAAGHDARQLARGCPTAMVFVPCAGGVSHNEAESAEPSDLAAGTRVLAHALVELADN
jgi:N-carbamoyl-L-amino-acid hydrolase